MSDDEEQPPPNAKPLDYWHSTERPVSWVKLVISFIAGFLAGLIIFGVACIISAEVFIGIGGLIGRINLLVISALWDGVFVASTVFVVRTFRDHGKLSIQDRRQPDKYVHLGGLIGFGVGALFWGISFAIVGGIPGM